MSKIAIFTDPHVGARNGSRVFRELFSTYFREEFFPFIKKNGIETILCGGDFFDNRSSITVQDIDYVINEFLPELEASGAHMHVIAGNHDVAYKNSNKINALSLLKGSKSVTVIDNGVVKLTTGGDKDFILCPWVNSENEADLTEEIKSWASKDHILLGHFSIEGMRMYSNSKVCDHGFKPEVFKGYEKVLSGHFHHPSVYGNIEYIGALFHYNWMDYGDRRGFLVYETDNNKFAWMDNPYCIFTRLGYEEACDMSKKELEESCSNQIVRIVIDEEYDRVDLKDLLNKIEKQGPISLDVVDNTILDKPEVEEDDSVVEVKSMSLTEYAENFFVSDKNADDLNALFSEIKVEAEAQVKDIE